MSQPIAPESLAAIRTLFFGRLAQTNRDLIQGLADLALEINGRNYDAILLLLGDVESRIQGMRNVLSAFEEYL
jgi:hypothetical protein